MKDLQLGVKRQFDEVREYVRSLAGVDSNSTHEIADISADPKIRINGVFDGSSRLGERILQIMLEGLRNARKHARATSVRIDASEIAGRVLITIADDGVGFPPAADPPWTIASHVAETGGRLSFSESGPACLLIEIPKVLERRQRPLNPLRLIIADDHALFRQGLRSLLVLEGLEVVAEVEQAGGLEAALAANPCDVLLLDLQMEQWSMDQIPELSRQTMVVVLTANESVEIGLTALRLGARAIVQKRFAIEIADDGYPGGRRRPGLDAARDAGGIGRGRTARRRRD